MYKFTIPPVNQWYKYHSIINIVKEERIQKEKKKKKYDIISFLDHCMKGWMSEVALKFPSYTYTFHVSRLLTIENNDFIYFTIKNNRHYHPIFHREKKHQVKLISRF